MKTTDRKIEIFAEKLTVQSTFICGTTATIENQMAAELLKLDSKGKIVYITDPYLFPNRYDTTYPAELEKLLEGLEAQKIVYCSESICNQGMYNAVTSSLQAKGIVIEHTASLGPCHDRFWYCPETKKCVICGTSLNGIGRKICRIDLLSDTEVDELRVFFDNAGIL